MVVCRYLRREGRGQTEVIVAVIIHRIGSESGSISSRSSSLFGFNKLVKPLQKSAAKHVLSPCCLEQAIKRIKNRVHKE